MANNYQIQLHQIMEDGTDIFIYPINTMKDVNVGKIEEDGTLTLPGSGEDETLEDSLKNIRKYLDNLSNIANVKRNISSSTTSANTADIASSKAVNDLKVRIDSNDSTLSTHTAELDEKAVKKHTSDDLTYGGATSTVYGHIKLSDDYATRLPIGSADDSVGASQLALYNAYNSLSQIKAPNNHANENATYGSASSSLYGHVKLSDVYDTKLSNGAADNALAASQNALFLAYNALKSNDEALTASIKDKAPNIHTSTDASVYGGATGSLFGHVKLSDDYNVENSETGGGF